MAGVPMPPGSMPSPYLDVQWTSSPTTNYEINSVDAMQRQMEQVQAMQAPKDTFGTGEAQGAVHGQDGHTGAENAPPKRKIHDNDWWNGIKNTVLGALGGLIGGSFLSAYLENSARKQESLLGKNIPVSFLERYGGKVGIAVGAGLGILASLFGV